MMQDPFPPHTDTKEKVRLQIPSHPRYVALARDFVYRLCLANGFSTGAAFDMKIISGEALINIIQHAYAGKNDQPILIDFKLFPGFAELRFRDFGKQSPVTAAAAHDLSDYRERGLGIFLIQNLSDYHYFDQSFKVGTELVLKKKVT